jgi:hypothetical protein
LSLLPFRAEAELITGYSGNSAPTGGLVSSTVNFAVFNRTGGGGTDTWNTGYDKFDTTFRPGKGSEKTFDDKDRYLYLYQVTNDWPTGSPNRIPSTRITLGIWEITVKKWGWFSGLGLADSYGEVTSINFFGKARKRDDPAVASTGVTGGKVVPLGAGSYVTPVDVSISSDKLVGDFFGVAGMPTIAAQQRSVIFGFTCTSSPAFLFDISVSGNAKGHPPRGARGLSRRRLRCPRSRHRPPP